jgi:hypothetical protein
MDVRNQKKWAALVRQNTPAPGDDRPFADYGFAIIQFAQRWADLMEERMKTSELKDIAEETCAEAITEEITGAMYGCAVSVLAKHWKHGKALQKWHNNKYFQKQYNGKYGWFWAWIFNLKRGRIASNFTL